MTLQKQFILNHLFKMISLFLPTINDWLQIAFLNCIRVKTTRKMLQHWEMNWQEKLVLLLSEYLRIFIFPLWEIHYKMAISILQKARQKTFLTRIFPLVKSRHLILFWIWLYSQNIIQMQYTVLMSQRRICIQSSKERCFGNSMA